MEDINKEVVYDKEEIFNNESPDLGKKIKPVPMPQTNIGIDTDEEFYKALAAAGVNSAIDIGQINSFNQLSQNRETLYQVLDTMAQDSTIAAMLETYTEDATETNDLGEIVWAESSDPYIQKYVTFLLDSLNVDKNIYSWVYSFIKYGDIYLRLFRQSDFDDNLFDANQKTQLNEKFTSLSEGDEEVLNEDVKIKAYKDNDRLVNYIEIVHNPAEMFELTKFGKSYAYVKTNSTPQNVKNTNVISTQFLYKFKKSDIDIYNAVSFVHGSLQDAPSRIPEEVQIFFNNDTENDDDAYTYSVRRGQSILYNVYKIWRQLMLLENSLLLNRLTKSSILRVIEVEVGDMPKERIGPHLQRIKSLIEQKTSLDDGNMMSEYTNPGPMENNIYVPTHNQMGSIQTQQIGGDADVKDIADIEYFKNKFYASIKIPKQFMGDTDDSTGFNGGTSLSIISSRYAKTIKKIQSAIIQTLTDAINILLIDRGLDNYVNKFNLRMQPPVTQEELDKRENELGRVQLSDDILRIVDSIEDPIIKLKITKSLLSTAITNDEVIDLIQEEIENLELQEEQGLMDNEDMIGEEDDLGGDFGGGDFGGGNFDLDNDNYDFDNEEPVGEEEFDVESEEEPISDTDTLPTPSDLDAGDFSTMSM